MHVYIYMMPQFGDARACMQSVAVCCNVLRCVAVCCGVLQVCCKCETRTLFLHHRDETQERTYRVLHYFAVCCGVLQCAVACCSWAIVCCSVPHVHRFCVTVTQERACRVLQCVAVRCKCVAVCYTHTPFVRHRDVHARTKRHSGSHSCSFQH